MRNISTRFTKEYSPVKSLVIYQSSGRKKECFVEAYDFSAENTMINAHPLSLRESQKLGKILSSSLEKTNHCFEPVGVLPTNVLYVSSREDGMAVWYTPAGKRELLFRESLKIASQAYHLPALLWKATKDHLYIYALKANKRPTGKTQLFQAPFFNIHDTGQVCMGTVDITLDDVDNLQDLITSWENYFFNSHFSHLISEVSPVKGNIVQLYHSLSLPGTIFPVQDLLPINDTVKNIINENS